MRDLVQRDTSGTVRLRHEPFALMTRVLGCENDTQRAALIGVRPRTIRRAKDGILGEVFMARTIIALRRHSAALAECGLTPTLDALFEVVDGHQVAV